MTLLHVFMKSVRHACAGIVYAFKAERNFQIELVIGVIAVTAAFVLPLSWTERIVILILSGLVLSFELLNTAVERLLDLLKPRIHPYVKVVKDVVAGAVLVIALVSVVIGLIIFLPIFWSVIAL